MNKAVNTLAVRAPEGSFEERLSLVMISLLEETDIEAVLEESNKTLKFYLPFITKMKIRKSEFGLAFIYIVGGEASALFTTNYYG